MKLAGQIEAMQTGNNRKRQRPFNAGELHPAWVAFIQHCQKLEFGEISQLKIQNGVPVMAEETIKKVKFV